RVLRQCDARELALADLEDVGPRWQFQALVAHPLAVDAHATLFDHAHRFRGTRGEARLLEDLSDRERRTPAAQRYLRYGVRQRPVAEARLEIRFGGGGGGAAVEALDDLLRQRDFDVARVATLVDLALPPLHGLLRLERQQLDVAPHQL